MAEALWRLRSGRARLITTVGDDADGVFLQNIAPGLMIDDCVVPKARTASYAAILDANGECRLGLGDMAVHEHVTPQLIYRHQKLLEQAPLVVLDGNVPQSTVGYVLQLCNALKKPVFFEPTDRRKAIKLLQSNQRLAFSSPNLSELKAMASHLKPDLLNKSEEIQDIIFLAEIVTQVVDYIIITLGSKGILTVQKKAGNKIIARSYKIKALNRVKSVSGAGDCFASGFINGILSGYNECDCILLGYKVAKQALLTEKTVPSKLDTKTIDKIEFEEFLK